MTMRRWQTDLELAPHEVAPGTAPDPACAPSSIEPDGEPALGAALADFFQVPFVEFESRTSIDPELVKDLKLDFLRKHTWVPLRRDAAGMLVLIDNPRDLRKVDSIRVLLPRDQVRFAVGL